MANEEKQLVAQPNSPVIVNDLNRVELQQKTDVPKEEKFLDLIPQLVASCLMYFLVIQAGISMSFSSVLLSQLTDTREIELDKSSASIIASIWSLSLPIGALTSGYLMDKYGRRKTALYICFPFTLAWLLVSLAQNVMMIYVARIISGITTGLTTCCVVYVAEISSKTTRSGLLCMNSVWVSFGIFLTYLLNFCNLHWRTIGYTYAVASSMCILAVLVVPESPSWLLVFDKSNESRRRDQVKATFAWLYKDQQLAKVHFDDLIASNNARIANTNGNEEDASLLKGLKKPQVYKPLAILFFLFLLQQVSGGYVLIFYTSNILRNLGTDFLKSVDERTASLLIGLIRLGMAVIAAALAQKCNRKALLYMSTVGMGVFALIASTQMFHLDNSAHSVFLRNDVNVTADPSTSTANNYVLLISILGYMLFASLGILIIPWTLISELYPISYKAKFGGASVAFAYVLMSIVLKNFPTVLETFSISVIFAGFGGLSFTTSVFVFFFLPETHRKTFAEIEQYFIKHNN